LDRDKLAGSQVVHITRDSIRYACAQRLCQRRRLPIKGSHRYRVTLDSGNCADRLASENVRTCAASPGRTGSPCGSACSAGRSSASRRTTTSRRCYWRRGRNRVAAIDRSHTEYHTDKDANHQQRDQHVAEA
jgi:hypothetical protein